MECLNSPCQCCARLCTSDCSKSGSVGGFDRITRAHNFYATIVFLHSPSEFIMIIINFMKLCQLSMCDKKTSLGFFSLAFFGHVSPW